MRSCPYYSHNNFMKQKFAMVQVHTRGDFSIYENDSITREFEQQIIGPEGIVAIHSRSFNSASGEKVAEDVIGII